MHLHLHVVQMLQVFHLSNRRYFPVVVDRIRFHRPNLLEKREEFVNYKREGKCIYSSSF